MEQKQNEELVRQSKNDRIFTLVKDEQNKVHIVVGKDKVSNATFDSFEQADAYIGRKPYELIFNISYLICKHYEETKKMEAKKERASKKTKTN